MRTPLIETATAAKPARRGMPAAASYAHLFGLGPRPGAKAKAAAKVKRPTAKTAASRVITSTASRPKPKANAKPVKRKAARSARKPVAMPTVRPGAFAHLFTDDGPVHDREAPAATRHRATAAGIIASAALARGETQRERKAPPAGSLAAKILAAGEKRRSPM